MSTALVAEKYKIKDINEAFTNWINGTDDPRMKDLYLGDDDSLSPVWNRDLSDEEDWKGPNEFYEIIKDINNNNKDLKTPIKCMAVGHTPQCFNNRGLNSACNYRLWRIDVGMSRAFGKQNEKNRKVQILEIIDDKKIKILYE